jgi:uncharacterized protein YcbK (DUF882 family)
MRPGFCKLVLRVVGGASWQPWSFFGGILRLKLLFVLVSCLFITVSARSSRLEAAASGEGNVHTLHLYHTHTGERIDIIYREGDTFLPEAELQLDHFLRDHRTGEVKHYDPHVFDILSDLAAAVGRPGAEIQIICGYRSSWSNEFLRARSSGVAKNSLHKEAHAIDIRIIGVDTLTLRNAALALGRGGVGYYPKSGFVHVDTGRVRSWCYDCSASQNDPR